MSKSPAKRPLLLKQKTQHLQRRTVLVVDDSADVAEVTSSLFEHLGYETIYRESAEAALKLLEAGTKIDLVFSGYRSCQGPSTASGLREKSVRGIPICRWPLRPVYSDAAKAAPSNLRILRKPFDTEALRDYLSTILRLRIIETITACSWRQARLALCAVLDRPWLAASRGVIARPCRRSDRIDFSCHSAKTISEYVRSSPRGGGGQISGGYRLRTGGPHSYAKFQNSIRTAHLD